MCNQQSTIMSPLPIKLAKITVVVIFFCFAECAAGSCLSYGHACWGAHGKRSSHNTPITSSNGRDSANSRWFLSRLIQSPLDLRYINDKELEIPTNQRGIEQQLFSDAQIEADVLKGQELQDSYSNDDNILFEDVYPHLRTHPNKIKTSKILEKRSARMI